MKNEVNNPEMPLGLGMALAQNSHALNQFAALPREQKQAVIAQTHQIESKEEMARLAQNIADGNIGEYL